MSHRISDLIFNYIEMMYQFKNRNPGLVFGSLSRRINSRVGEEANNSLSLDGRGQGKGEQGAPYVIPARSAPYPDTVRAAPGTERPSRRREPINPSPLMGEGQGEGEQGGQGAATPTLYH